MSNTYHKIHSIYKRDPATNFKTFLEGQWSEPEFEFLANADWNFDEKIDGTNIRVIFDGFNIHVKGKTDNAHLPPGLEGNIKSIITFENLKRVFADATEEYPVCLYGEGYGAGIQKGGKYRADKGFILFDIKRGSTESRYYLPRTNVIEIANTLKIDLVPNLGVGTLYDAINMCKDGIVSTFGDFEAEGIVARPKLELRSVHGNRIITKVKCCDFRK